MNVEYITVIRLKIKAMNIILSLKSNNKRIKFEHFLHRIIHENKYDYVNMWYNIR